jgi:hypothetical protein
MIPQKDNESSIIIIIEVNNLERNFHELCDFKNAHSTSIRNPFFILFSSLLPNRERFLPENVWLYSVRYSSPERSEAIGLKADKAHQSLDDQPLCCQANHKEDTVH